MTVRATKWADTLQVTGEDLRLAETSYWVGSSSNRVGVRAGTLPGGSASNLAVNQTPGNPSMNVVVPPGHAIVQGTESTVQGAYIVVNDADLVLAVAPSDATNPRIDIVVVRVRDKQYSGSTVGASIEVITGVPAPSPTPPAAPANSVVLAQISVPAGATAIQQSQITDVRPFTTTVGGITPSRNSTDVAGVYKGQYRYRLDTGKLEVYNGSAWVLNNPVSSILIGDPLIGSAPPGVNGETPGPIILQAFSAVTAITDSIGTFTVNYVQPFPNGVITIVVTPGDIAGNLGSITVRQSQCTTSYLVALAHQWNGSAVTQGSNVRVNVFAVGW